MPMRRRTSTASTLGVVDVLAVEEDFALGARRRHQVVHAVEGAQHRALAAAGRADQRRDLLPLDVEVDVAHGHKIAVKDPQVFGFDGIGMAPVRERDASAAGRVATGNRHQMILRE
jgi:hypothetical protein